MLDRLSTYVFAGGGTGGHLTPGLAVVEELLRRWPGARCVFAGSDRPVDRLLLAGHERVVLPIEPLATLTRRPWRFLRASWQAWNMSSSMLRQLRPECVCGLGGLASLPVLWAAYRAGIPTVILEQNVIPGRANRHSANWADLVCTSFPATAARLSSRASVVCTGNPVRPSFARLAESAPERRSQRPLGIVLGGSQGAQPLNQAFLSLLRSAGNTLRHLEWVHQAGTEGVIELQHAYRDAGVAADVSPFFADLDVRLPLASIVVSRAGATTLAELACAGSPAVLIPYPQATDRHQDANATEFVRAGAAVVVPQSAEPAQFALELLRVLEELLPNRSRLDSMRQAMTGLARPDAARRVVDEIDRLIFNRSNSTGSRKGPPRPSRGG